MSSTARIMESEEVAGVSNTKEGFCGLCSNRKSLYLCPRCNIPYCSMECYKNESHSHCTENFYYEQVKLHLAVNQKISDGASEKDVEEILKRQMQDNEDDEDPVDSDDDSDVPDLADRLAEVDIDDADELWKHLTPDEQQAFQAALSSGAAFELVPDSAPWWGEMYRTKVITKDFMDACRKRSPVVSTKIVDFNKLTKKPPVDHLIYNIANVLAAYSFTCRYFNGNHMELADEAATCIAHLSLTLMCNKQYSSFAEAVACVSEETTRCPWILAKRNYQQIEADLCGIFSGPHCSEHKFYLLAALSDLCRLFHQGCKLRADAGNEDTQVKTSSYGPTPIKVEECSTLRAHMQKIKYYLSFVKNLYVPDLTEFEEGLLVPAYLVNG